MDILWTMDILCNILWISCEIKGLNFIVYKLSLPHINVTSIIRNNNYDQEQLFPQGNIHQELRVRWTNMVEKQIIFNMFLNVTMILHRSDM